MTDDAIPPGQVTLRPAPPDDRRTDEERALIPAPVPTATWRGRILKVGAPTINGRVYPKEVVERALAKARPSIEARRMLGTFADAPYPRRLNDAAFVVADMRLEEGFLVAELETLATPQGRTLCALLADPGVGPASLLFRTEGVGSVHEDGRIGADYSIGSVIVSAKER